MKTFLGIVGTMLVLSLIIGSSGCDKQRTVTSTEIIHDTKYIELPGDTVRIVDTVSINGKTDTVRITVTVHDTVVKTVNHYDTVRVVDTVNTVSFVPTATTAIAAMQAQTDPQVFQFAKDNFGMTDGWVLYLSPLQMLVTQTSAKVWDIGAYVDYWTADWSGYYPLEVYWRMTYKSGDPTDPNNWTMGDPPAAPGWTGGLNAASATAPRLQTMPAVREATLMK